MGTGLRDGARPGCRNVRYEKSTRREGVLSLRTLNRWRHRLSVCGLVGYMSHEPVTQRHRWDSGRQQLSATVTAEIYESPRPDHRDHGFLCAALRAGWRWQPVRTTAIIRGHERNGHHTTSARRIANGYVDAVTAARWPRKNRSAVAVRIAVHTRCAQRGAVREARFTTC